MIVSMFVSFWLSGLLACAFAVIAWELFGVVRCPLVCSALVPLSFRSLLVFSTTFVLRIVSQL